MAPVRAIAHKLRAAGFRPDDVAILITPEQDVEEVREWNKYHRLFVHFCLPDYPVTEETTMHQAKYAGYLIIVKESA